MSSPSLVPAPTRLELRDGHLVRGTVQRVRVEPAADDLADAGRLLAELLECPLALGPGEAEGGEILFTTSGADERLGAEGYVLEVSPEGAVIRARQPAGASWAVQTLRQLLPETPALRIRDVPRFPWRGLLLDCCRHFPSTSYVKRTIDRLAYHKLNRLHWHLTEDQGWRLEIERYPRLLEVGAWRTGPDGARHGGYYSKDDVREILEYARARHVTVVPEIEMPGHCVAALAAYPELSCTGGPHEVETRWGIFEDVYCAGNDAVFEFLEHVLDEVLELFPSPWIHVGGDEVPRTRWQSCPRCQERIRREGLADEDQLQSWFLRRIETFLGARGRTMIGWDEVLEGGLPPRTVVQSWRGLEGAVAAARAGHDTVVSPTSHCYLDYDLATIDLEKAYDFDPVPPELSALEARHVLGGECNMWTERAPEPELDGKIFPRLLAVAERLWTGADRSWPDFHGRLQEHHHRLHALGVRCGPETA